MSLMGPKMDTFLAHIKELTKIDIPLEKVHALVLRGPTSLIHMPVTYGCCKASVLNLQSYLHASDLYGHRAGALCAALGGGCIPGAGWCSALPVQLRPWRLLSGGLNLCGSPLMHP